MSSVLRPHEGSDAVREHGSRARYVWGPAEDGEPGRGCRCGACTGANRAGESRRERQILYGRWQPYTDAEPARQHVRQLGQAGIGWRRAAELAGVPTGVMSKLLFGGPGGRPPSRRIRPETEAKILAVRASLEALGGAALVDATGTRRRLQALVAAGYSQAHLASRLGMTPANFGANPMRRRQVTAATARAVRALYDELWKVPPDESSHRAKISASRARNHAREHGWPLPLAWDDDAIDDPAASPAEGWQRPRRIAASEMAEEAAELIRWGHTREQAAERLGVRRDTLDTAIRRSGQRAS